MSLWQQKARVSCYDNVSFIANKGKKSAMKTWIVSDYADNSLLKMIQNLTNISDKDVLNIENFVVMYDRASQVTSINNARLELFAAKNRTLENIRGHLLSNTSAVLHYK